MIQSAQVASKFTLFTHHAKTFPDLVTALRNSMLRTGVFKDERTAAEQVVQVLNFDIHLVKDFRGVRYIERITECIPVEEKNEYTFDHRKEKTLEGKMDKFMDNAAIFFGKTTNRELYKYRNIMEYVNDAYVLTNPISDTNIKEMRMNMEDSDIIGFDAYLERNWGIKPPKMNMGEQPAELNSVQAQKAVPVSAAPVGKTQAKPVKRTSTATKTAQAKAAPGIRKKVIGKTAEDTVKRPTTAKTKKTDEIKNKPTKSSILGNFDFDEDEN